MASEGEFCYESGDPGNAMSQAESDGFTDRFIHRPCARLVARFLVVTPVTPNAVTLAGLVLGLGAAWQFLDASPRSALLGLFLYALQAVADHADGELARLTGRQSVLGRWLDVSADTLTDILVVLAMAASASHVGGRLMFLVGAVAAVGVGLNSLFVNFLAPPRPASIRRETLGLANRDPLYGVLVGFIFLLWKADRFLPLFIWVLAVGSHVYWPAYLLQRIALSRRSG